MPSVISISKLAKYYQVPEREAGLKAAAMGLIKRRYKNVKAVDEISFEIQPGEVVGFLGPNGAGKTTTLKCSADFYTQPLAVPLCWGTSLPSVRMIFCARSRW
jgi:ABC-2 type transport system ATP-binding protein